MYTKLNLKKKVCFGILLCIGMLFTGTTMNTATAQTYDPYAVQVINNLIKNNGLQATPDAPETWTFARWNDEIPKQLIELQIGWIGLTGIASFAGLTALEKLYCGVNELTEIDLTSCVSLQHLSCSVNNLSKLDITDCTQLGSICFGMNQITEIDVTKSTKWWWIYCEENCLTELDLTGSDGLLEVEAYNQNVSLILNENEIGNYSCPISLNNPTFNNNAISYTEGILTSTDNIVANSNFKVQTIGNDNFEVSGTMNFSYIPLTIKTPENIKPNVYPNPVKDVFFIECETFNHVILYDISGKAVLSQSANSKTAINVSHLPNGVYIVNAISKYKVIGNAKIVKQ